MFVRRRRVRGGAVVAIDADQPLGEHHLQGKGDHVTRHPHVEQADRRRNDVVGVQGGEHHVAGNGGAHADFGGHLVAHFADQNDVRVLTQGGAQDALEGVRSIFSCTCTWLMPGNRYSTGSSTVMIFFSVVLSSDSAA